MSPGFLGRLIGGRDEDDATPDQPAPGGDSFRARVERFWDWFEGQSEQLHQEVSSGSLDPDKFLAAVQNAELGLAWEFCKGTDTKEGFVLTGEADTTKGLLARYAIARGNERPALREHWKLHHMKLPSEGIAGASVKIDGDRTFAFSDFLFSVGFDAEAEQLEIDVHHPLFKTLEDGARWHLTWLALDNALGESLVKAWVGVVKPIEEPTEGTRHGIDALCTQARAALSVHDLDPELDPLATYSSYERREQSSGDLLARGDVIAGTTKNFDSIRELENDDDELNVTDCGAALAYLVVPVSELGDRSEVVDTRSRLEDELQAALEASHAGEVMGGATGEQYAYVDLLLVDEERGLQVASQVIDSMPAVQSAVIRYFSPSRIAEQVAVHGPWEAPPPGFAP